jgi:hypothetical protein
MTRTRATPPETKRPAGVSAKGSRAFARRSRATPRGSRRPRAARRSHRWSEPWEALKRVPAAAWMCALVALLNAVCWSIVTPPFQTPDEPAHFAYVQYLAETGHLPSRGGTHYAPDELVAMNDLRWTQVRAKPGSRTITSQSQQRRLSSDLARPYPRTGEGDVGLAVSEPPLYYALETIPYGLLRGGTILDQLALMRLVSTLMAAITALFAFLFIREAMPTVRWAWTVGGLGVALAPLLGFMSGAVNPDSMLYAVSAALFFALARGFRRGLNPRLACAIGVIVAVGLLTKVNFVGLIPGALVGLLVLTRRAAGDSRRAALQSLALALALAAIPVLVYAVRNLATGRPVLGLLSSSVKLGVHHGSILDELSYMWQYYLPRLPGMAADFHGISTTRQLWFEALVGRYGWLDTTFPAWVYTAAIVPVAAIVLLLARALVSGRVQLRLRVIEPIVYALMGLGVMALVAASDYLVSPRLSGGYVEPRYVLPMVVLWGGVLALSARGAGRRYGPAVGAGLVLLVLAHDVFSQILVVTRYYG